MQVITTHLNADFDGMAAMIAAQKLYPDALLVFSGSQEKSLRDFISQTLIFRYDFHKLKDIDLSAVSHLIVVDTRVADRIGPFKACLNNPNLKIDLYDHHLDTPDDMKGDFELVRDVGSTCTVLTQLFREKAISLTAEEATIICLGIYEDTGSLAHLTTTPEDLRAAAWLLEQGARLDTVAQFISYDLTTHQVELLHQLMQNATSYTIQDIPIAVATLTLPEYVDDFSLIIRRFIHMENLDNIFALLSMAGRIYLIGRSRIPEVNVGTIARDFGGGGHASAASATVRDMTIIEAEEKLVRTLHRHVRPQPIAREMLSQPAITIPADTSLFEAKHVLTRYNITALPVMSVVPVSGPQSQTKSRIVGIISRGVIEKSIHHNLGDLPVSEYMTTDIQTLSLDATLADIQELIIEHRQRLIPIVQQDELRGIITRTDLLNKLVNDPAHLPKNLLHESEHPSLERRRNLNALIAERLDRNMVTLLSTIGEVAESLSYSAYAVGGFVRDLLLKKENFDLDIVIEGDGINFAKALAARLNGRARTHSRFLTAMVLLPDGFKVDVATARLEYYEYPAALPTVELSSIKLDLFRRDFTINAMAIHLNPSHFGTLIDFFNCQNDLKHRTIRVLHNLSFVEDPTRIFRAFRFEKRMDFTLVKHTQRLIRNAVNMKLFGKETDPRFLNELQLILSEENPIPAIIRLSEFDLFQFLWPDLKPHLKVDRRFTHRLNQAHQAVAWFRLLYLDEQCLGWMVYLLTIMGGSGTSELQSFCKRFQVQDKTAQFLLHQKSHGDKIANILSHKHDLRPSEIFWLLEELSNEGLLYTMAIARKNGITKTISTYVTEMRKVRPELTGEDLKSLGYQPGPLFRTILTDLLNGRLDGELCSRTDELAYITRYHPL